jgi:predicted unusual protein kinase regulating ubiquinone biosynthesis (AarF/ABC1/UbiB family)
MQNSKTPISASDSAVNRDAESFDHNGEPPVTNETRRQRDDSRAAPPEPVTVTGNRVIDPVTEPDFLTGTTDEPADSDARYQPPQSLTEAPSPAESTVREADRPRSLRMQLRFWKTLIFAGWIFARVIFWQVLARRYFPDWVEKTNPQRWARYARQYRNFAIKQGGVYIKLGQFISTRVDILSDTIIRELESLQDEVPTVPFAKIRQVIETELGPISEYFAEIKEAPIAAASLGQVHRARLLNDERVVIKVQRPRIREVCYTDLAAMRIVARVAMKWSFISNRADAPALVGEFGRVLLEELSYKHEAYNAVRFAEIFKDDLGVYIPTVYHEHSTDRVLTIEDVTSIKITDYAAMEKAGISRKAVAKRLMDTYLKQVFNEYFFHADPHPGNLFIYPLPVENENAGFGPEGRPFYLIFVDFGMTGTLTREIADGMVTTLAAILTRDAERLVDSYLRLGFVLPGANTDRLVEATRAAFDQVWGLSLTDIRDIDYDRVIELAGEFNDLIFSMPFYMPQDFIYLGRMISILSGMCTSLDPQFNPWRELQPYTETLIARGFGIDIPQGGTLSGPVMLQNLLGGGGAQVLRNVGEEIARRAFAPITRNDQALQQLNRKDIHITAELSAAHRQQLKRIERESRRTGRSAFFGSVLVASTILYVHGHIEMALAGAVICGLTLLVGHFKD